jgi:hypothetical protein
MSHLPHQNGAHLEVSGTLSPEPCFSVPPYPRGIVELLRAKGHTVALRQNRHGSIRYRVDGGRELQAIEMDRLFARLYERRV